MSETVNMVDLLQERFNIREIDKLVGDFVRFYLDEDKIKISLHSDSSEITLGVTDIDLFEKNQLEELVKSYLPRVKLGRIYAKDGDVYIEIKGKGGRIRKLFSALSFVSPILINLYAVSNGFYPTPAGLIVTSLPSLLGVSAIRSRRINISKFMMDLGRKVINNDEVKIGEAITFSNIVLLNDEDALNNLAPKDSIPKNGRGSISYTPWNNVLTVEVNYIVKCNGTEQTREGGVYVARGKLLTKVIKVLDKYKVGVKVESVEINEENRNASFAMLSIPKMHKEKLRKKLLSIEKKGKKVTLARILSLSLGFANEYPYTYLGDDKVIFFTGLDWIKGKDVSELGDVAKRILEYNTTVAKGFIAFKQGLNEKLKEQGHNPEELFRNEGTLFLLYLIKSNLKDIYLIYNCREGVKFPYMDVDLNKSPISEHDGKYVFNGEYKEKEINGLEGILSDGVKLSLIGTYPRIRKIGEAYLVDIDYVLRVSVDDIRKAIGHDRSIEELISLLDSLTAEKENEFDEILRSLPSDYLSDSYEKYKLSISDVDFEEVSLDGITIMKDFFNHLGGFSGLTGFLRDESNRVWVTYMPRSERYEDIIEEIINYTDESWGSGAGIVVTSDYFSKNREELLGAVEKVVKKNGKEFYVVVVNVSENKIKEAYKFK